MHSLQILMEDHRLIERVLDSLETAAGNVRKGRSVEAQFFRSAADFIQGFADGSHHHKEEGVLFDFLSRQGLSREQGPLAVMLAEHEQGRAYTRAMRAAAEAVERGETASAGDMADNALQYAALLRQHIQKEDQVLYPMALRLLPLDRQEKCDADIDRIRHREIETGLHQKYIDLAASLEAAASR